MASKPGVSKYIRILIVITVILFLLYVYTYVNTSDTKLSFVIFLSYVIVPFLTVIVAGIIFIFPSPTWKNFFRSLFIPSIFAVLTFGLQIIAIYLSGERLTTDIGTITLILSFVYTLTNFILFSAINSIIVYNHTHKTKKRQVSKKF